MARLSHFVTSVLGLASAGTEVAGMFGASKAASGDTKALTEAQKAMAQAGVDTARYNFQAQQVIADAQKYGWDSQKIITELQIKGVINTNEANKSIAGINSTTAIIGGIRNLQMSKLDSAKEKQKLYIIFGGIAVLLILIFVGFMLYKKSKV